MRAGRETAITLSAVLVLIVAFAAMPGLASGDPEAGCSDEQAIFVRDTNRYHAYGTTNEILTKDRDLANGCSIHETGSMAHMEPGPTPGDLVEIGWREFGCGLFGLDHCYQVRIEDKIGDNLRCLVDYEDGSHLVPETYATFRVANRRDGTNQWYFSVDFHDGSGFRDRGNCLNSSNHGKARGETWRFGGSGTGMSTTMINLRYKPSSGSEVDWPGTICDDDPVSGWEVVNEGAGINSFQIAKGSTNCTFIPP